jgi:hypothetical protein
MATSTTRTVDAAAILSSVLVKNELRRESGLPLWPIWETFAREWKAERWRVHVEEQYAITRKRVVAELRARHGEGFGLSAGGRWVIEASTSQASRASFRTT